MSQPRAASTPPNANGLHYAQTARRLATHSGLSVLIPPSASLSQDGMAQLQDADDYNDTSDLGADLTPTSNATPSLSRTPSLTPDSQSHGDCRTSSHSRTDYDTHDTLPPLLISPAELESLKAQLSEKTALLSVATDHISEQSVQIQRLTTLLQSQEQSNASLLSSSLLANSDEMRQFQLLVNHLHQMIAQRDEIISEQEKELNYYQQQLRAWKNDRARELDEKREREARMKAIEAELAKYKSPSNHASNHTSPSAAATGNGAVVITATPPPPPSKPLTASSSFTATASETTTSDHNR